MAIVRLWPALTLALASSTAAKADDVFSLGRQGIELSRSVAAELWPGMAALGDGFVVLDDTESTAVCFESAPGFRPTSSSPLPDCRAHVRERVLPRSLQASLNLFGPEESVVVAAPDVLDQSHAEWLLKFVHERFHQWQSTRTDYLVQIDALELAGDDTTGMWMLNYPFPYDDPALGLQFRELGASLLKAIDSESAADARAYVKQRKQAFAVLNSDATRYAEFQLWKEGAARWTEIALGDYAATTSTHNALADAAAALRAEERAHLADLDLATYGRGVFYALGAFEWALVDQHDQGWREAYAAGPLAVAPYLTQIALTQR